MLRPVVMAINVLLIQRTLDGPLQNALSRKGFLVRVSLSVSDGIAEIQLATPDVVIFNSLSFRTSGRKSCQRLNKALNGTPLIMITEKASGCQAQEIITPPFTPRKVVNRVAKYRAKDPTNAQSAGEIRLDDETNRVRINGHSAILTPLSARLLGLLMRNAGSAVSREQIMREIWNTSYFGDTRTIDVHVSWLRKAIEKDPRNPQMLVTVRGVGFRLDT